MPGDSAPMRIGLLQFDPHLMEPVTNASAIATAASDSGVDLLVTPELALTGYGIGDAAAELGIRLSDGDFPQGLQAFAGVPDVVVGLVERGQDGRSYNTAVHLRGGRVLFRHRKIYLPTYGMFDEGRFFARGSTLATYAPRPGWRAGVLVCEDLWHPALPYVLAVRGIDLLIVLTAAPGRGVWQGHGEGAFASAAAWERIARTTAQIYGVYVALANRVGAEEGITFAGGSLIISPDGALLGRAADHGGTVLTAELDRAEVARARRPFDHARDDDPALTYRVLREALADGAVG